MDDLGLAFLFRKLGTVSDGTETTGEMAEINAAVDCEFVLCVYIAALRCFCLVLHLATVPRQKAQPTKRMPNFSHSMQKCFKLQGALPPDPLTFAPGPH